MVIVSGKIRKKFKKLKHYHIYDTLRALINKKPQYPLSSDSNTDSPFFIIGSGRSGNTLLRSILVNKEGVVIPPESYIIGNVIRKYYKLSHFKNISWSEICALILANFDEHPEFRWWGIDLNRIYQKVKDVENSNRNLAFLLKNIYKEYAIQNDINFITWGDKTPLNTFHMEKIHQTFPKAKYIHIVRDGRDVAASYRNSGLYDSLEKGCKRWNDSMDYIREFKKTIGYDQLYELNYEDLVTNTENEVKGVCEFLNIAYTEEMIKRPKNKGLGDVDGLSHHSNVWGKINTSSIGKWRKVLTTREKEIVNHLCEKYLRELKYK